MKIPFAFRNDICDKSRNRAKMVSIAITLYCEGIFSIQNMHVTLIARLLKIIFVHVRIFTGIIWRVRALIYFSHPKEA